MLIDRNSPNSSALIGQQAKIQEKSVFWDHEWIMEVENFEKRKNWIMEMKEGMKAVKAKRSSSNPL